jgi:hypothetical protein
MASVNTKKGRRARDAVKEAVRAIWGQLPAGIQSIIGRADHTWFATNSRVKVSTPTIRRALDEMRDERT